MIVEKNDFLINLMCFELPHKLELCALQRQMLPIWPEFFVHKFMTVTKLSDSYYILEQHLARDLGFCGDLPKNM